jgi:transposase
MVELDIKPIFNVGYSPEFNPIERIFSKVKRRFNAKRLSELVNNRGFNFERTINASFREVTVNDC